MRLKRSFCNSENRIGSELLQVSEVSHKSWSLTIRLVIKRLHRLYSEWDKARFLKWAAGIGEATHQVVQGIFDSYRIEEQAYKGCLSLLKLADKYTPDRLEYACKAALERIPSPRYKNIRLILESGVNTGPS